MASFAAIRAEIVCNECEAVVRTVAAEELSTTLNDMMLSLDVAAARCPHCEAVHLAAGFTSQGAFVYPNCGKGVDLTNPNRNAQERAHPYRADQSRSRYLGVV